MRKNNTDLVLLLLRLGFGGFLLTHGIPKLQILSDPSSFADPIGVGPTLSLIFVLLSEVVAPILLIIGYKAKWATLPPMITMLVAAFIVHAKDDLGSKEKAILYFFAFLAILLAGAGRYSLDGMRK